MASQLRVGSSTVYLDVSEGILTLSDGTNTTTIDPSVGLTQEEITVERLNLPAATELTIASGAVAATQMHHTIDTQGDAASDDLDDITGGANVPILLVRPASGSRTVVLKHALGANKIACPLATDIALADATDWALLVHNGTQYTVLAGSFLSTSTGFAGLLAALVTSLESALAATTNGDGAAKVGIEDAAGTYAATTVEGALAALTPVTLTPAAEANNAIAVAVQGPAHVAQYLASVYSDAMVLQEATAYTLAETGAGAEVSTTAQAQLLFTTDATGAATVTCTDVSGVSTATLRVIVQPVGASAGPLGGGAAAVAITFA